MGFWDGRDELPREVGVERKEGELNKMRRLSSEENETWWAEEAALEWSDLALVERAQAGDREAFEELVQRYYSKIYSFAYRMVSDAETAADLTQEVFLRAFAALPSFRLESSFQTWIFRIASNLCVDRHRRAQRRGPAPLSLEGFGEEEEEPGLEVPDWSGNPERILEREELRAKVQEAIGQLSEKLRTVLLLYDFQGLSYEEIARVVGCPVGTVKSRLFNARAALRRILLPYLEGDDHEEEGV